jgi:TATA-box binding protein (TBP) (component of TFIID and TFIIIB)
VVLTNQYNEGQFTGALVRDLFGVQAPLPKTSTKGFPDAHDFAGTYLVARRPYTGFTTIYGELIDPGMVTIVAKDNNTLTNSYGEEVTQVRPYVFQSKKGGPLIYVEVRDGKVTRFAGVETDLLPMSGASVAFLYGSLIATGAAAVYMIIAAILAVIGMIRRRIQHAKANPLVRLNQIVILGSLLAFVNNAILIVRAIDFAPYSGLVVHFIVNMAYVALVAASLVVVVIRHKRMADAKKRTKVFATISGVSSLAMVTLMFAWQFFS